MINKNKLVIFVILLAYVFFATGCKKFLDKKQDAATVVPSNLHDLQALMDNGLQTDYVSPSFSEASSDEFYVTKDIYNSFPAIYQSIYTWRSFVPAPNSSNDWGDAYHAIYYDNLVLDVIKSISRNDKNSVEWDNIKGTALFFRAYHFLNLLWQYSKAYDNRTSAKDMGIVLRETSNFNVPSKRATNEDSYRKVIEDIEASILLLPEYAVVLTRPSKGAAYGLLARVYLSMRNYNKALLYADSALQLNHDLIDFNNDVDISGTSLADNAPFKQYNKETILYCSMNMEVDFFTATAFVDSSLISLYDTSDLRKIAYFRNNGSDEYYFKGSYSGSPYVNFTGIATDEMYITRAECLIREGEVEKGLQDLNTLLESRYKSGSFRLLTGMSEKDALYKVLQERRKELLFRGNRWIDIKRFNKEGADIMLGRDIGGQVFQLKPNSDFYALPIPEDIIAITGIPQN